MLSSGRPTSRALLSRPVYDTSEDEYESCSEAPVYENLEDDDEDEEIGVYENVVPQDVYENVVFEPPAAYESAAYANVAASESGDSDGQVYANVLAENDDFQTYDVPQRKPLMAPAAVAAAAQEYANVQQQTTGPVVSGLSAIVEESESGVSCSSGSASSTLVSSLASRGSTMNTLNAAHGRHAAKMQEVPPASPPQQKKPVEPKLSVRDLRGQFEARAKETANAQFVIASRTNNKTRPVFLGGINVGGRSNNNNINNNGAISLNSVTGSAPSAKLNKSPLHNNGIFNANHVSTNGVKTGGVFTNGTNHCNNTTNGANGRVPAGVKLLNNNRPDKIWNASHNPTYNNNVISKNVLDNGSSSKKIENQSSKNGMDKPSTGQKERNGVATKPHVSATNITSGINRIQLKIGGSNGSGHSDSIISNTRSSGSSGSSVNSNIHGNSNGRLVAVSAEDIPSIVNLLPEVDPPAEARRTTGSWDPTRLVNALYTVPEPLRDKPRPKDRVNIEGFLERLPCGRKKATFWNAWKRCYFRAKDGFLYCYASKHSDKPIMTTQLMGGQLDSFESIIITAQDRNPSLVPMIGIDDRMGHYLVIRAGSAAETARWLLALRTHTVEDFCSTYVQPWPMPRAPALLRDSIVIDLGSCSVRAGILCSQPSLPQLFLPAVCASRRTHGSPSSRVFGLSALQPRARAGASLSYPVRASDKINKNSVDLGAVAGLVGLALRELGVDPRDYGIVLSVPRALDAATQARLVADLFDLYGVRSVLLSHQSVLALYAYNASSGVVVDIGERADVVPIMDGYIVEGGVTRVPYGGEQVSGHVRRFLLQRAPPLSFSTVPESFLTRLALEKLCFVSSDYRSDLRRSEKDPSDLSASISVREFFSGDKEPAMESLTLDTGRFQAPEGLFHPQAWGVDFQGVHKMVYKAIQECSMDARKTMARSVFLAGGLTLLPGFPERLRDELERLLPPSVAPKVHASPYRYHAAYIGACVLANSSGVGEMLLTRDEWTRDGCRLLRPWIL